MTIGASAAADSNQTNDTITANLQKNITDSSNLTSAPNTVINGTVTQCQGPGPFEGATIKVKSLAGTILATAVTNAEGKYSASFYSTDNIFQVSANYPGHVIPTQMVNLNADRTANADFQMGTLNLTKGSWDIIGLDSNNVNVGPNQFLVQIHVKNNALTTATNVTSTFTFTTANAFINLAPGENATKNLGNIAPGATVDVFYLIQVTRNAAAYNTFRNYTISISGNNTGSADSISGQLYVEKLISQNRNRVNSITVSDPNPNLGDIIVITMVSSTAASNYDVINLPVINYDPTILQPVNMTTTFAANTTNNIQIPLPGTNSFVSVWYFRVIGTGLTSVYGLITDLSGASYHYNSDFGVNITVNATKEADLAITKTVNNTSPTVGQNVAFTITAKNNGPNDATLVLVNDLLPAGLSFVSANATQGSYNSITGVWTIGNLSVNGTAILTIVATVTSAGQINNIANITGNETDPNLNNNHAIAVINSQQQTADLAIQKTVDNATPNNGDIVNYLINLFNAGPDTANNVVVSDLLQAGLILLSAVPSQGTYNTTTGVWNVGTLLSGASAILSIQSRTNRTGLINNTANVTSSTFDPDPTDNNSTVTINVQPSADLAVIKVVNNTVPNVGQSITFTITVTNNGPDNATGVLTTDLLPVGLTYLSSSANQGSYNNNTGLWTIGNITSGNSVVLTIVANVTGTGQIDNSVNVTGSQHDPNLNNNQDLVSLNGQPTADLAVTKTVDNSNPNNGKTVTFTINVFNAGPNTATNVLLSDLLPVGLILQSANPSQGSYNSTTGIWSIGTMAHPSTVTMTIVALANQTGFFTNIAHVNATELDPHQDDNTAAVTIKVNPSADLAVNKVVNNSSPNVGQNVIFTITVTNNGPDTGTFVQVVDNIPAGLIYVSSNAGQGSYNPGTGVWTIGTLIKGASVSLNITAMVNTTGNVTNIATVSGNENDPNPLNNQDLSVLNGSPTADLAISKTADKLSLNVGETVTFTINVFNAGPNNAVNVVVSDLLPAGLQLISATPSVGSYNNITGVWTIGNLAHEATATLLLVTNATQPGVQTNNANVTSNTFDPHPEDNSAGVTVDVHPSADLSITKTANDTTPDYLQMVTFTIVVKNNGPNNATGVVMNDFLPVGLNYVSSIATQGSYNNATGVWTIGNMTNGSTVTLTINATVVQAGLTMTNIATVSGNENDPNPTNNQAIAILNGNLAADLAVQKQVDNAFPFNGQNVTFTIHVSNNGPNNAADAVVYDLLPAGLQFISANATQGSYNNVTGAWVIGNITNGTSVSLKILVKITQAGLINNTAIVNATTFDPNLENNNSTVTLNVEPGSDMAITKTVSDTTPNVGQSVTFTLTVTNNGLDDNTGVVVNDLLPAGLQFLSASTGQGSYDNNTGIWTIGNMSLGSSVVLTIVVNVTQSGNITNMANVTGDHEDLDPTNNQAIAILNGEPAADLAINKTVNDNTPNNGDIITFTITVFNAGPNDAVNVLVSDLLPAGLNFVSANPSVGTYNSTTGVWTVGNLLQGANAIITIVANVTQSGSFTNVANTTSDTFDPHPEDNRSEVTVDAQKAADIAVTKSVDNPLPNYLQDVTFTITVTNHGPDNATNVIVSDLLPAGLIFLSANPSQGTYNPATGIWIIGNLDNGSSVTLLINATVNQTTSTITNIARGNATENDPNPSNNEGTATLNGNPAADLAISKTVDNLSPYNGNTVHFTLTITNAGPDNATGVFVTDLLPAGLQFVSASADQGTYNATTGIWTIGNMTAGSTVTMIINALVTQPGEFTNTAVVEGDQFDPHQSDNTASVTVDVQPVANVSVNKTASNYAPNYTQNVSFTITVTNNGPDNANGVIVNDVLPNGLSLLSYTVSQGTYNPISGTWTIGTLNNGASAILNILAQVLVSNTTLNNTATKTDQNEFDNNTTNDSSQVTLNIPPAAELTIQKTVNPSKVKVGKNVIFTLTVNNKGPDTAIGAFVLDVLSDGFQYISSVASTGSYNPATGLWTIGDLPNGSSATLSIVAKIIKNGVWENVATVGSSSFNPNPGGNSSSAVVDVIRNGTNGTNGSGKNVPMQDTGAPLALLAIAVLTIVAGIVMPKGKD